MIRFQFLPHYFKYIALILYLVFGLANTTYDFILGLKEGLGGAPATISDPLLPEFFFGSTAQIIAYIAIILYALSRDKTFDELMIKLRLESVYYIFFGTILFSFGRYLFNSEVSLSASALIEVQVICYILLNAIQKRILR